MKKIFTLAAAVLASVAMMAQTITISEATQEGNWYEVAGVGRVSNKSGSAWASTDMECEGIKAYKTGSSYFTIQTYVDVTGITVAAQSTSNRTIKAVSVSAELEKSAASESNVEFTLVGGSENYAIPKNECGNEFTLNFSEGIAANSYIQIVFSGNAEIIAVTLGEGSVTPATDPVGTVSIDGPEAIYVGEKASYTATTDVKADAYKWFVNEAEQEGANAAKFDFTPEAAGTYTIACLAKNDNNADWVASEDFAVVVTEKSELEQVEISGSTVWDWTKASALKEIKFTAETNPKKNERVLLANVEGINNDENFNAQALLFEGEYAIRDSKYCQGQLLQFKTTVAGTLDVEYSNTGNRSAAEGEEEGKEALRRFITVNGELVAGDTGSMESKNNTTVSNISVKAGEVAIGALMPYSETPEAPQYVRFFRVSFRAEGDATAITNTEAAVKAVKRIVDGQLMIEKNGVLYNAQGAVVK